MVDITLLGTSSLIPLPDRAETAAVLRCAGHSILFDCGEGTQCAARKAGVSLMKTDLIALTHYHGDHIFGLPGLMQTMAMMGRTERLWITGPGELQEELEPVLKLTGWVTYPVELLPMPEEGLPLAGLAPGWPAEARLTAFPTEHRVPSQGYCFTLGRPGKFSPERAAALGVPKNLWGKLQHGQTVFAGDRTVQPEEVLGPPRRGIRFVFSGDTVPCSSLTAAARDADLLICDATYGETGQAALAAEHGHMTFAQAAQTAASAGARRLWLAHYSQMIKDPEEHLPAAAALFPAAVCGEDGMHVTLNFEEDSPAQKN